MLTTGSVLQNRYRIVSLLGQGGMGSVYRAWDMRLSVPVALKEMTPQPGLVDQTLGQLRQQFHQEATVLARLHHPHLVRVTDFFEESGNAYLVMDFVEGESLADRIAQQGALPETEVLVWAKQLLSALAYCHSQGIIHRDIKPQNVIIRPDGQAVLVDFGLVKLWDPNDPRTKTVMRGMGTPEYAPPEQYEADTVHTDSRSDIYSVGATLYHALAGQAPLTATLRMASPERFMRMREISPGVSPAMEEAVDRALELNQSRRWQSADEMAAALGVGGIPTPTQAPGRVTPATPRHEKTQVLPGAQVAAPARRRVPVARIAGGAAVLLLLMCLGLLCVFASLSRRGGAIMTATAQAAATQVQRAATAQMQATHTAQAEATATAQSATTTAQAQATATAQSAATATARAQATATAQSAATATAQAQAAARPEARATATMEACIHHTSVAPAGWSVVLCDTFTTNENDWFTGEYEGDLVMGEKLITNGKYRWDATAHEDVVWWSVPDIILDDDFYLTVEARRVSGVESGQYGLVFRRSDSDNYALFKIEDGQYFKFSLQYGGEWHTVIDWTETSAVLPGKVNRLTVIAEGTHYTFYVNDQYVGEAEDDRLSQGKAGMVIELIHTDDTAVFEFDNLEIRAP
jgi:cell wall-associated NlpC family hydrolase